PAKADVLPRGGMRRGQRTDQHAGADRGDREGTQRPPGRPQRPQLDPLRTSPSASRPDNRTHRVLLPLPTSAADDPASAPLAGALALYSTSSLVSCMNASSSEAVRAPSSNSAMPCAAAIRPIISASTPSISSAPDPL